ncbi:MAG: AAA family ATPase [Candidatus Thiodiazotropha taylori]|nr:AAA family ATPase [Candidatus Thiodiazotropha taylori]
MNDLEDIKNVIALVEPKSNLDWTKGFTMTIEEAEQIETPEFIIPNLIIQGHVVSIVAEPNGGKTTLMLHMAGRMSQAGHRVIYVNADVSAGDAKSMVTQAHMEGFELLLPDMKAGSGMADVVAHLKKMNAEGGDFSRVVFIFDTLKKMVDVIQKSQAKDLYTLLRGLSSKGMTIILLAHTNKYKGTDGKPVFEGTGDLRSDVDELIYLIPQKHSDGSMTISTEPDKVRGKLEPMTFTITSNRVVIQEDQYIDVAAQNAFMKQYQEDLDVIEVINRVLHSGLCKQIEIRKAAKEQGVSDRVTRRVLKTYSDPYAYRQIWTSTVGMRNTYSYERL